MKKMSLGRVFKYASLTIVCILFLMFITRIFAARQIDDISPGILCEEGLKDKADIFFVIPIYNNNSIAENISWCKDILALNKTLGMHGVYHTYNEFGEPRSKEYIQYGLEDFKKCFGYYPAYFEAPQLKLNSENKALLEELNMTLLGWPNAIFRKVYHCRDKEEFSIRIAGNVYITNKLINWI